MNTLEIQNIKSHFSNILNHYNSLKSRFIDAVDELESLNLQLIELKNKINNLTMNSSILYFFEIKETLASIEKGIFDLDSGIEIPEPPVTPEPPVNPEPPIEPEIPVIPEPEPPVDPEPPVEPEVPNEANIATLKLTSSQSWNTGFSTQIEVISHTNENFGGNWELSFESPATGLSQWQINCSKVNNRLVITSGKDWAGNAHFNLSALGNFTISDINGSGAAFDKNIAKNATLNGKPVTLIINGETIEGGTTTPDPEPPVNPEPPVEPEVPTISFPDRLPILNATDVEAIYFSQDNSLVLGTVSIPNPNIHSEYAIYVNGSKCDVRNVEFTRRSSMVNVNITTISLPLVTGTNTIQLVFAGTVNSTTTYYQTNTLSYTKESTSTTKRSLIGYWSSWGGNGPTSYIDLEDTPVEYDTIAVSFIEHKNDYLTPQFNPEDSGQVTRAEFRNKVARMRAKGHDVIIAIGGQNGVFKLGSEADKAIFKNGVISIIEEFGFNGFDIDLEGQSTQQGNTTYIVAAIKEIIEYFRAKDPKFIYSMAPEVAYLISTGFGTLYIDLIRETKHLITTIHPQYYNAPGTGVYPFDGSGVAIDCKNQARFVPEFTEALIKGHDGPAWGGPYAQVFPVGPIPEEMLAIGLPSGVGAAGTGAINDMNVYVEAWREIERRGYTNVKGFMTWSIDWDKYHNWQFKNALAPLIK